MEKETIHNAPYWKRLLAFAIDEGIAVLIGVLLYLFVGTTYLYEAVGGKKAEQELISFCDDSGLVLTEKKEDGTYETSINPYYFAADGEEAKEDGYVLPEDGKEAYEEYYDRVYAYYTVFLSSGDPRVVRLEKDDGTVYQDEDYLAYFNDVVLGLSSESGNPYFQYGASISAKPVLKDEYQEKVDAGDTTTLKALRDYFFDPEASSTDEVGVYYDAILDLMGSSDGSVQTYYSEKSAIVTDASSIAQAASFIPVELVMFLILPLAIPGGLTLGKAIMKLRILTIDGDTYPPYWVRALRALYVAVLMALPFVPYQIATVFFLPLFLVDALMASFGKTGQSLHDRIFKTRVIDGKTSHYFRSVEEKEEYIESHPGDAFTEDTSPMTDDEAAEAAVKRKERHWTLEDAKAERERALSISSFDEYEDAVAKEIDGLKGSDASSGVDLRKGE